LSIWSTEDAPKALPSPFEEEKIDGKDHSERDPYLRATAIHDTRHGDEPIPQDVAFTFPHSLRLELGSRAMEAFVRPSPIVTAGVPTLYTFDLANCSFLFKFTPFTDKDENATEIFIPDYFFRGGAQPEVAVSTGRWECHRQVQLLRWWHEGSGEQTLRISSGYRHTGMAETVDDAGAFYLGDWLARFLIQCKIL
jgi:Glycoside hydrolase family 5 C-terminal domain